MIRVVVENIILFLLPTLIYVAYVYLTRPEGNQRSAAAILQEAPIFILIGLGAAIVLLAVVAFGSTTGGKPGQTYQPPVIKDGKIVPGEIK